MEAILLATQLCAQNDWTGWQNGVNCDAYARPQWHLFMIILRASKWGTLKARETRDAQFMQKFTRFALIGLGPTRPLVCECPPPQIPVSQSPF